MLHTKTIAAVCSNFAASDTKEYNITHNLVCTIDRLFHFVKGNNFSCIFRMIGNFSMTPSIFQMVLNSRDKNYASVNRDRRNIDCSSINIQVIC